MYEHGIKIVQAGPLVSDHWVSPIGILIIVGAPDREAVQNFIDNDPYVKVGLFSKISLVAGVKKTD